MFCIIYKFIVREGQEERFIDAWSEVTKAFIESSGGLGSRLHRSEGQEYIAYAQWPSKEIRDKAKLPESVINGPSKIMKECCESIETIYELSPVVDLLIHQK